MNKKLLYSLIASLTMISAGAYANEPVQDDDNSALTTKGYVDAGLKFVYDSAKSNVEGIETDITNLQTALSDGDDGLINVGAVADDVDGLKTAVGDNSGGLIKDVDDVKDALSNGNGGYIDVGALKNTVDTLDNLGTDGLDANKKYIMQTNSQGEGSWSEIKVESTWNPTAFTNNVVNGGN